MTIFLQFFRSGFFVSLALQFNHVKDANTEKKTNNDSNYFQIKTKTKNKLFLRWDITDNRFPFTAFWCSVLMKASTVLCKRIKFVRLPTTQRSPSLNYLKYYAFFLCKIRLWLELLSTCFSAISGRSNKKKTPPAALSLPLATAQQQKTFAFISAQ